jgi:hypothetical protein
MLENDFSAQMGQFGIVIIGNDDLHTNQIAGTFEK